MLTGGVICYNDFTKKHENLYKKTEARTAFVQKGVLQTKEEFFIMSKKMMSGVLCAGMLMSALAGGFTSQAAEGGYTFAMLIPTMNHEYFENCVEFANSCAEKLGCEVTVYSADNNADTMSKNVEDAIAAGVDGILIDPYYASGMKCAEMCEAQGIPMIAFDSDIEEFAPQEDYSQYISFIGPDDADAGYNIA